MDTAREIWGSCVCGLWQPNMHQGPLSGCPEGVCVCGLLLYGSKQYSYRSPMCVEGLFWEQKPLEAIDYICMYVYVCICMCVYVCVDLIGLLQCASCLGSGNKVWNVTCFMSSL